MRQSMKVYVKYTFSITFRKVQIHPQIADTQNVTEASSRRTITWVMRLMLFFFIDTLDSATDSRYL